MDKPCTLKVRSVVDAGRKMTDIEVAKNVKKAMKTLKYIEKAKIYAEYGNNSK
jgi:hypothetical protein